MGVLPRLALFLTTGLVGLSGTACAAEPAPAVGNGSSEAAAHTVRCPEAQCTVTVEKGTVVDLGDAGSVTVTDVGSDSVTTTSGGSRITSGPGGSNTVDGLTYRVVSVRHGAATLEFSGSD